MRFVESVLNQKMGPLAWLVNFSFVVALRLYLDKFIAKAETPLFDLIMDLHNLLFFFLIFALIWVFLSLVLARPPFTLAYLMSWSALAIVFPPVFDLIKTGGHVFWSFYLLSSPQDLAWQYLSVFGHLPSGIVYFGTKVVFIFGVLALTGLVFVKTRKILRTVLTAWGTYTLLFFMAAFPSIYFYLVALFSGKDFFSIRPFEIIQFLAQAKFFGLALFNPSYALAYNLNLIYFPLALLLLGYFFQKSEPQMFRAFLQNLRYPQVVFHGGLFCLGLGVGMISYRGSFLFSPEAFLAAFNVLVGVFLAWEASVVVNDLFDQRIDQISNPKRPLPKKVFTVSQYAQFGAVLFFLSLLGGALVHYKFAVLLFLYQGLAWFYSAKPFRLKRVPLVASFLSAWTLLTVFFCGFIFFSPEQNLERLPWRLVFLLLLTYTASLPIKDFKDIKGDRQDGVRTIPVVFGEEIGRLIVAGGIFVSFVSSGFFLGEPKLYWWSLLFGSLAFLIVANKKSHPRKMYAWVLALVTVYGLISVVKIF